MRRILAISIKILDLEIPIIGLVGFLLGFATLLLFIYFIITFSLFQSKKSNQNWTDIMKLKEETSFKEKIEYFEKEIMLAKKRVIKNR